MTGEKPTREIEQILRDDTRNSMCWWWPRVADCGVPMPETRIIEPGEGVPKLFEPDELLKWLDQMHIYDIGRDEAGNRLVRPEW